MTQQGEPEKKIYEYLSDRKNSIPVKLKSKYLADEPIIIPEEVSIILFKKYKTTRNELTHPKEKDHSIYQDLILLRFEVDKLVQAIAELIICIQTARNETFPYWLTGWNFINMNGNPNWPMVSDNMRFIQQFRHTQLAEKLEEFEQAKMKTIDHYRELVSFLATQRCEPQNPEYPHAPRLCKTWWDPEHTKICGL